MNDTKAKTAESNAGLHVRPQDFSREVAGKHIQFATPNTLQFLNFLSGDKFMAAELPGLHGSLIYKNPGGTFRQSFYTWYVESRLSLTINKLAQYFGVWLNQGRSIETLSNPENKIQLFSWPWTHPSLQMGSLNRSTGMWGSLVAAHEVLGIVDRVFSAIYKKHYGARRENETHHIPSFQTIESWLTDYATLRAYELRREFRAYGPQAPVSAAATFVAPRQSAAGEPSGWIPKTEGSYFTKHFTGFDEPMRGSGSHYQLESPRWGIIYKRVNEIGREFGLARFRKEYQQEAPKDVYRPVSLEPMILALSAHGMAEEIEESHLIGPFADSAATSRTASAPVDFSGESYQIAAVTLASRSSGVMSDETAQTADRSVVSRRPAALTNIESRFERNWEARLSFPSRLLLNGELVARTTSPHESGGKDQQDAAVSGFTFLRPQEQMRPPLQSYAYAQPLRSITEEGRVITRVREKEIVEAVRKEVGAVMKSRSPMEELPRGDLSRLADQVYSALARRLMIEKERLGLHA
jgi:hypothetical protein